MSAKAGKRPLRSLSAHEKLDAIQRVHDGESKASVARDIGVPESTLRGWCKNESKISYLSRQSTPETDDSLHVAELQPPREKRPKLDDAAVPFNLSLKSSAATTPTNPQQAPAHSHRSSYSPNSDNSKYALDFSAKADGDAVQRCDAPLNLISSTPKSSPQQNHLSEKERTRAELNRLSVEYGLNRPESYSNFSSINNMNEFNRSVLAPWSALLFQHMQQIQLQQLQHAKGGASKKASAVAAAADTSTAKPEKAPKLPKSDAQKSVDELVWNWLRTHHAAFGMPVNYATTSSQNAAAPPSNGHVFDQNSLLLKLCKQNGEAASLASLSSAHHVPEKPILYQQLTREKDAENARGDKPPPPPRGGCNGTGAARGRSVFDDLLLINNNNNLSAAEKRSGDAEDADMTPEQGLEHGERFLRWLERCGEPSVTAVHIIQLRGLLNNIRSGADRKNGSGAVTPRAKVKRK